MSDRSFEEVIKRAIIIYRRGSGEDLGGGCEEFRNPLCERNQESSYGGGVKEIKQTYWVGWGV